MADTDFLERFKPEAGGNAILSLARRRGRPPKRLWRGFALGCQAEFPESRMCTSAEVLETVTVPVSLAGEAWVRPSFRPVGFASGSITRTFILDESGHGTFGNHNPLTCASWGIASSSSPTLTGLGG